MFSYVLPAVAMLCLSTKTPSYHTHTHCVNVMVKMMRMRFHVRQMIFHVEHFPYGPINVNDFVCPFVQPLACVCMCNTTTNIKYSTIALRYWAFFPYFYVCWIIPQKSKRLHCYLVHWFLLSEILRFTLSKSEKCVVNLYRQLSVRFVCFTECEKVKIKAMESDVVCR